MQIARQLLIDTRRTIIDIAEQVGYHSEAAFGRVFRKHFDIGPSSYRRITLEEQAHWLLFTEQAAPRLDEGISPACFINTPCDYSIWYY